MTTNIQNPFFNNHAYHIYHGYIVLLIAMLENILERKRKLQAFKENPHFVSSELHSTQTHRIHIRVMQHILQHKRDKEWTSNENTGYDEHRFVLPHPIPMTPSSFFV